MNSEHIKYFLDVVKFGSINKASEKLNINHQHLGRIITSLENEIGAKLLERSRVGVTLTPQGIEVLELIKEINALNTQLQYHFSAAGDHKKRSLKICCFAMSNYHGINTTTKKLRKLIENLTVEIIEMPSIEVLNTLANSKDMCFGQITSFDDYPTLCLNNDFLPDGIHVIGEKQTKLVMLASSNNPISDKYNSISMESLCAKPLVIYAPYDIAENHFFKLLSLYGEPQIKYTTSNLQTYYDLLRTTECVSIGVISDHQEIMFNPLFTKEQQLRMIPVRENILMHVIYLANNSLSKENNSLVYDIIKSTYNM